MHFLILFKLRFPTVLAIPSPYPAGPQSSTCCDDSSSTPLACVHLATQTECPSCTCDTSSVSKRSSLRKKTTVTISSRPSIGDCPCKKLLLPHLTFVNPPSSAFETLPSNGHRPPLTPGNFDETAMVKSTRTRTRNKGRSPESRSGHKHTTQKKKPEPKWLGPEWLIPSAETTMTKLELLRVFGDLHCVCKTLFLIVLSPSFNVVEHRHEYDSLKPHGLVDPKNV